MGRSQYKVFRQRVELGHLPRPSRTVKPARIHTLYMPSRTVRLEEDVYERLKAAKRDDETFSEAVDRLLGGGSLVDLVGLWEPADIAELRVALAEADAVTVGDVNELVARLDRE